MKNQVTAYKDIFTVKKLYKRSGYVEVDIHCYRLADKKLKVNKSDGQFLTAGDCFIINNGDIRDQELLASLIKEEKSSPSNKFWWINLLVASLLIGYLLYLGITNG